MTKTEYLDIVDFEILKGRKTNFMLRQFFIQRRIITNPSAEAIYYIGKMQYLESKGTALSVFRAKLYHKKLVHRFGMCVSPNCVIGKGLHLPHPTGIVIGNATIIGENCSIYQNCTVGGARIGDVKKGNQPNIGSNVTLFSGGMVLGKITVVNDCTIAANSVLLRDALTPGTYAGSPARKVDS